MNPIGYFLKNKIVHNFLITSPNGMNQSFRCRQKYIILEEIFFLFNFEFLQIFFCCPPSSILGFLWYNFFSQAPIEIKIIFPQS